MLTPEGKIYLSGVLYNNTDGLTQFCKDIIECKLSTNSTILWSGIKNNAEEVAESIVDMLERAQYIADEEKDIINKPSASRIKLYL